MLSVPCPHPLGTDHYALKDAYCTCNPSRKPFVLVMDACSARTQDKLTVLKYQGPWK